MTDAPAGNIPLERLIAGLSRPEAYPETDRPAPGEVSVVQTHISVVFLTPRTVYKVKKPVDFGFLDFTTLEKRLHFCQEEVRLNRRTSADLYLGVVPVTLAGDDPVFGGKGEPVEYAVVMRRLPEERLLSSLLARGEVTDSTMERIAEAVAVFHRQAEAGPEIAAIGGDRAVAVNTEENFAQIAPYVGDTLSSADYDLLTGYTRAFREANAALFAVREREGWIRDGHGDLHTQHIFVSDRVLLFDCIEFNQRFRFSDVLCDAAFLAMDLTRLGHPHLAETFTRAYLARMGAGIPSREVGAGEGALAALYNFYLCYRAVVRGKVEGFRSRDPHVSPKQAAGGGAAARDFFRLAGRYARTLHPPTLFLACGLMGSGKSALASGLTERLDLVVLSSDLVRKELAGLSPTDRRHLSFGQGLYSPERTEDTYRELERRARVALGAGGSVFLDASFADPRRRAQALTLAREAGVRPLLLYLRADEALLRERLEKRVTRVSVSDGRVEILPQQARSFVPPDEVSGREKLVLEASAEKEEKIRAAYLRALAAT